MRRHVIHTRRVESMIDPAPLPRRARGVTRSEYRPRKGNAPLKAGEIGQGVLPRTRPTPDAPALRVRTNEFGDAFTDAIVATEVYRAHTQPELYDHWQIALIDDNWLALMGDRESRDCDGCRKAIIVDHWWYDACPNCGQEAPPC